MSDLQQPNRSIKNIEVGKFYLIHDGSKTGHPGYIIWKNDVANLYLIIKFGSTKNNDNTSFPHPLSKNINKNYIYKRPILAKRKDIGKEWAFDNSISKEDKIIFNKIACLLPIYLKSINRKDRRFFNLVKKQKQIKTVI